MTSAINAQIKQGLFILLTASVLFVGGWIPVSYTHLTLPTILLV